MDKTLLDAIESFIPERVLETESIGHDFLSGLGPIATVMYACKILGAKKSIVLRYSHSGNVIGDPTSVVGYGAAVFTR
jgi:AmmeMemoRadiSam system protein B